MSETPWSPPEGYVEWKPPEGYVAVDTLPPEHPASKTVAAYTKAAEGFSRTPALGIGEHAAAAQIPPEHRELFKALLAKQYQQDQTSKNIGYGGRLATSAVQGVVDFGMPLAKLIGAVPSLDPEQERFKRELLGIRQEVDPTIRPDTNILGRGVQQATQMIGPMGMSIGAGSLAGQTAKLAGAGKLLMGAATAAGTSGSFLPQIADQTYTDLIAEGIKPERAKVITAVSAPIEAAIESILPDPLSPFAVGFKGTIRQITGKLVKQYGVNYLKELSEEGLQGIVHETAVEVGRQLDEQIPNQGLGNIVKVGIQSMQEAALPLALMMAPGAAVGSAQTARGSLDRKARLEELQAIRAAAPQELKKKAAEAGITGSRSEIRKQVDSEIEQLQQENSNASTVRGDQAEVPRGQVDSGPNLYQQGQNQVPAQSAGEGASTGPEVQVTPPQGASNEVRKGVQNAPQGQNEVQPGSEPQAQQTNPEVQPPVTSSTGLDELGNAGSAIVDNMYQGVLDSLKLTGEVPSAERKSNVGVAWNLVRGSMSPEEFVEKLRRVGQSGGTPEAYANEFASPAAPQTPTKPPEAVPAPQSSEPLPTQHTQPQEPQPAKKSKGIQPQPAGEDQKNRYVSEIPPSEAAQTTTEAVPKKPKEEPAFEPVSTPPRVTPKDDARRQELWEQAATIRERERQLEKQKDVIQKQHDATRRNAHKKRGELQKQIRALGTEEAANVRRRRELEAEARLMSIEDALESPASELHRLAGVAELQNMLAIRERDLAEEEWARRGQKEEYRASIRENALAKAKVHSDEAAKHYHNLRVVAEDFAKAEGLVEPDEASAVAERAIRDFSVTSRSSLADLVKAEVKSQRRLRADMSMPRTTYLAEEKRAEFEKQFRAAAEDDAHWHDKQEAVKKEMLDSEAAAKKEHEADAAERAKQAAEEAKVRQREAAIEERAGRKVVAANDRYFRQARERAKSLKGTTEKRPLSKKGEPQGSVTNFGKWSIDEVAEPKRDEGKYSVIHAPSGLAAAATNSIGNAKLLVQMIRDAQIEIPDNPNDKGHSAYSGLERLKDLIAVWDKEVLGDTEVGKHLAGMVEVPDAGVTGDMVLDASDLIPKGETEIHGRLKNFIGELPEFAYNPVFTVNEDRKLVFKDGYKFTFSPSLVGLDESLVEPGQTVALNLPDVGIERPSPEEVVKAVLGREFAVKSGGKKGGLRITRFGSKSGGDTLTVSGGGHNWEVTSGAGPDAQRAQQLLDSIPWTRKEQIAKNEAAAEQSPAPEKKATRKKPKTGMSGGNAMAALTEGDSYQPVQPETETEAEPETKAQIGQKSPSARVVSDLVGMASPAHVSDVSREAGHAMREEMARAAQWDDAHLAALRKLERKFYFMSPEAAHEFIDRLEAGEKQATQELDEMAQALRTELDKGRDRLRALGKLQDFYENYFPHLWKDVRKASETIRSISAGKPWRSSGFLKERTHITMKEGRDAGLVPISDNPIEMALLRLHQVNKYVARTNIMERLKQDGMLKFVPESLDKSYTPAGYEYYDDPAFRVVTDPSITMEEAYDKLLVDQLSAVLSRMGVKHERVAEMSRGKWGQSVKGQGIKTRYAGPVSVLAHELGHQIGDIYGLYDYLTKGAPVEGRRFKTGNRAGQEVKADAQRKRAQMNRELRALADLRVEGQSQEAADESKQYRRKKAEKEAVILEAWLAAPDKMAEVAPMVTEAWKDFLKANEPVAPLLNLDRSVVLGTRTQEINQPGVLQLGKWAMPTDVARMVKNMLSPGLRGNPNAVVKGLWNLSRVMGNSMNQASLSLSAFHGLFVLKEAVDSQMALGMQQLLRSKPQPGRAIWNIVTAPAAGIIGSIKGGALRKAAQTDLSLLSQEDRAFVTNMLEAGARASMDPVYHNYGVRRVAESIRKLMYGSALQKVDASIRLPVQTILTGLEMTAKPLMEWMVPNIKLYAFYKMNQDIYDRANIEGLSDFQRREQLSQAWDSVDNRLGQLAYDNLFWNQYLKDVAMLSVRSVGWNLGSFREYGGAVVDVSQTPARLRRGDQILSRKMAYAITSTITSATIGALVMYALTGKPPEEWKDYFFPKTGKTNPDGSPERLSLPNYSKDIAAWWMQPLKTAEHKLHPMWGTMTDVLTNEDYYGVKIRNEDDPWYVQLEDTMKHVGESFVPFSVKNMQRFIDAGEDPKLAIPMALSGITSAPAYISRSPAQKLAYDLMIENMPQGSKTTAQAEASQQRKAIVQRLREGGQLTEDEIKQYSKQQLTLINKEASQTSFQTVVSRLSPEQSMKVWGLANDKEKDQIRKPLQIRFVKQASDRGESANERDKALNAIGYLSQIGITTFEQAKQVLDDIPGTELKLKTYNARVGQLEVLYGK